MRINQGAASDQNTCTGHIEIPALSPHIGRPYVQHWVWPKPRAQSYRHHTHNVTILNTTVHVDLQQKSKKKNIHTRHTTCLSMTILNNFVPLSKVNWYNEMWSSTSFVNCNTHTCGLVTPRKAWIRGAADRIVWGWRWMRVNEAGLEWHA